MATSELSPRTPPATSGRRPRIGLALGSGAARGWAHIGVLRAFRDIGVTPDVLAGCSVGALVGGAWMLDVLPAFEKWARELGPLAALRDFSLHLSHGGVISPDAAFKAFRHADRAFADLPIPFGVNATNLGTGREVWLTRGSVMDAVRASCAIPMVIHAAHLEDEEHGDQWLVDGALSNPVPVDLARHLGADRVIAVDLTAVALTLERFDRPKTREVVAVDPPAPGDHHLLPEPLHHFVDSTRHWVDTQIKLTKAKMQARPHFFETAVATIDIFQTQLAEAKAQIHRPDIRLMPDMRAAGPTSFDRADEFIEIGYQVTIEAKDDILALFETPLPAETTEDAP